MGGENSVILQHFSKGHVHRPNRIGRVDGFANLWRKSKERNDPSPMTHPALTGRYAKQQVRLPWHFAAVKGLMSIQSILATIQ